jgi:large subunit ribosomal protein L15
MKLHELRDPAGKKKQRKRIGRGIAAGQGKTGGYGTKGNGARSGRGGNLYFEGGQLPLVRRLPHNRGFKNRNRIAYSVVNVGMLGIFEAGSVVDATLSSRSRSSVRVSLIAL